MTSKCFFFLLTLALLTSCVDWNKIQCGSYQELLRDPSRRQELLSWTDAEIFTKTFKDEDFDRLAPSGPGRYGGNIVLEKAGIIMPPWLSEYKIRSVGPDKYRPNVILIGRKNSQGILVTRGELEKSLKETTLDQSRVEEKNNRMAMMCYSN